VQTLLLVIRDSWQVIIGVGVAFWAFVALSSSGLQHLGSGRRQASNVRAFEEAWRLPRGWQRASLTLLASIIVVTTLAVLQRLFGGESLGRAVMLGFLVWVVPTVMILPMKWRAGLLAVAVERQAVLLLATVASSIALYAL